MSFGGDGNALEFIVIVSYSHTTLNIPKATESVQFQLVNFIV